MIRSDDQRETAEQQREVMRIRTVRKHARRKEENDTNVMRNPSPLTKKQSPSPRTRPAKAIGWQTMTKDTRENEENRKTRSKEEKDDQEPHPLQKRLQLYDEDRTGREETSNMEMGFSEEADGRLRDLESLIADLQKWDAVIDAPIRVHQQKIQRSDDEEEDDNEYDETGSDSGTEFDWIDEGHNCDDVEEEEEDVGSEDDGFTPWFAEDIELETAFVGFDLLQIRESLIEMRTSWELRLHNLIS